MPNSNLDSIIEGSDYISQEKARIVDSLRKVLTSNPENFILDSSSIILKYGDKKMLETIYDIKDIAGLRQDFLDGSLETIKEIKDIASLDNVLVIPEVTQEVFNGLEIINKKLGWYKQRIHSNKCLEKIQKLGEIASEVFYLTKTLKSKEVKCSEVVYSNLLKSVKAISEKFDQDSRYKEKKYFDRKKEKKSSNLETDEKIIATIFYKTLTDNKPYSSISNDIILSKKFTACYALLTCEEIDFLKDTKKHNMKIYGITGHNGYMPLRSTFRIKPQKDFRLFIISEEENLKLKNRVKEAIAN